MMRILVCNWTSRLAGGAEAYVQQIIRLLAAGGHALAFASESNEPAGRPAIELPAGVPAFALGSTASPGALSEWRPDVSFVHSLLHPAVDEAVLAPLAPRVFLAHDYFGTCISGEKTHKFPGLVHCGRTFGLPCLALYFPRRCGGWSPVTMASRYATQRARLRALRRYDAVLTLSEHMRAEFLRHGAAGGRVTACGPCGIHPPGARGGSADAPRRLRGTVNLLFVGRMDRLKGGAALLGALPRAAGALDRPIHATFAGAGPEAARWRAQAEVVTRTVDRVSVDFTGWLDGGALAARFADADLLAMPSLWPEPFGLAGLEANSHGVPVVAYASGGIPEWLREGVNGCLAPADPPTVDGLADAIVRCVRSLALSDALRAGAREAAASYGADAHVACVAGVLSAAAAGGR